MAKDTVDFKNYYSFEDSMKVVEHASKMEDWTQTHREKYFKLLKEYMYPALQGFFTDLQKAGKISTIENSVGHNSRFSNAWNKLAGGKELDDNDWGSLNWAFAHNMAFNTYYFSEGEKVTELALQKKYNAMTKKMTKGTMHSFECDTKMTCSDCGQRMLGRLDNWQIKAVTLDMEGEKIPKSCIADSIVSLNVEFKTGNLLINDWFRFDELNELEKNLEKKQKWESLNNNQGVIDRTKGLAKAANIISVSVGNNSPRILIENGKLCFGQYKDEDSQENKNAGSYKDEGFVCSDFWGVTIIEKENLIEILSKKAGIEKATKLVENYIKDNWTVNEITIEPGKYTLKFHGDYEKFEEKIVEDNKEFDTQTVAPFFTLEKNEMKLTKKKKIK
jgi:hypothetical protein